MSIKTPSDKATEYNTSGVIKKAYLAGYSAAEPVWRSVNVSLPYMYEDVLVWLLGGKCVVAQLWESGWQLGSAVGVVTHWLPITAPKIALQPKPSRQIPMSRLGVIPTKRNK